MAFPLLGELHSFQLTFPIFLGQDQTGESHVLLKQDLETLSKTPTGTKPPDPVLHDPEIHHKHRAGQYRASLPKKPSKVIELPSH